MKTSICRLKFRRGAEKDRVKITPEQGEPVFSTDAGRLAIGDGKTKGGVPINKTWTREPDSTAVVVSGDIKLVDGKSYVYSGNNWIQTGGSGLVTATAPLKVIGTNNVTLNIGSDDVNSKYVSLGTFNGNLTVTDTNDLISTVQNVSLNSNSIETLSANRIYKSVQPLAIAYSAIYDKSMEEVPSDEFDELPAEITELSELSGTTADGRTYSINRGIKLLHTNNFTFDYQNVSFYEYDSNNTLVKVTSSLPHLDVNLDNITAIVTTAATTAAIDNVNNTINNNINTAVSPISSVVSSVVSTLSTMQAYVVSSFYITSQVDDDTGVSWGRVWSDGWLEQGGFAISDNQVISINFPVSFNDTSYNILVSPETAGSEPNYNPGIASKTIASATWNTMIGLTASFAKVYWYACGYNKS